MDLFDALGPAVARELSHLRESVPRAMIIAADAPQRLARALLDESAGRRAALVYDRRTHRAAGRAVESALADRGFSLHRYELADGERHGPVCDDRTLREMLQALPECDVLIGVGSGVVSDLVKWAAFERGKPAAIFATAASMNGYAAANVAPAIEGVKTLVHARAHRVIASDPQVLADAPRALTSAGLGDVIAKTVSTADWKMNELLFGERYSDAVAGIIDHVQERFLSQPERIAACDTSAIGALFEALVYSGCAMTLQGSSLPASGGEHLISHALDMRADVEGVAHDLHGRQVGVGTIFAAALYRDVLAISSPGFSTRVLPLDRAGWGAIADSVASHHQNQTRRLAEACDLLARKGRWEQVRQAIAPMLPDPQWVKDVLRAAGAAHRVVDIGCDRVRFLWAVGNCAQIRERFTSIDLAWAAGVLPGAAPEVVAAYLS